MDLSKGPLDLSRGKLYPLDGSDPIVLGIDDVRALLPAYAQEGDDAPMRLAVLTMIMAVANFLWPRIGRQLNALRSPRFASGAMLDVWGQRFQTPRVNGEDDGSYRARLLTPVPSRAPNAIRAAVTALFRDVTGTAPAFQEPGADGLYVADDSLNAVWSNFIQPSAGIIWGYDPKTPNPTWGNYIVPDTPGAQFWIIMQLGAGDNGASSHMPADDPPTFQQPSTDGMYVADDDLNAPWSDFVQPNDGILWGYDPATPNQTWGNNITSDVPGASDNGASNTPVDDPQDYIGDDNINNPGSTWSFISGDDDSLDERVVALVEARKAFGMPWMLIEEPFLQGAQ
jgi:hypothetical protein